MAAQSGKSHDFIDDFGGYSKGVVRHCGYASIGDNMSRRFSNVDGGGGRKAERPSDRKDAPLLIPRAP